MLAVSGACISPAVGRLAVWPGCLLHGVLPGVPLPTAAAEDGEPEACSRTVAATAAAAHRTTLILAWWQEDPRQLVKQQLAGGSHTSSAAPACPQSATRPLHGHACNSSSTSRGGAAGCHSHTGPEWLGALHLGSAAAGDPTAAGCSVATGGASGWRCLPSIAPAWQQVVEVSPDDAAATAVAVVEQQAAAACLTDTAGADSQECLQGA